MPMSPPFFFALAAPAAFATPRRYRCYCHAAAMISDAALLI
jgi:hypothetical protein